MSSEIVARLEELRSDLRRKYMTGDEQRTSDTLTLAITVIKALEPLQWIPVSERLPEIEQGADCVSVLVQFQPSYLGSPRISTAEYRRDGTWAFMDAAPLRWMPLTVLPKP